MAIFDHLEKAGLCSSNKDFVRPGEDPEDSRNEELDERFEATTKVFGCHRDELNSCS